MNSKITNSAALILIDIQKGFDDPCWGERNNPDAEANAGRLLDKWRKTGRPVFHVQHLSANPNSPLRLDSPGSAIKDIVKPIGDEAVITKNVHSAFIGTNLEHLLRESKITQVVLVGITADHCVNTSTRMAADLGFKTFIVADATVAFERKGPDGRRWSADDIHSSALASLHEEFALVVTTGQILAQIQERTEKVASIPNYSTNHDVNSTYLFFPDPMAPNSWSFRELNPAISNPSPNNTTIRNKPLWHNLVKP